MSSFFRDTIGNTIRDAIQRSRIASESAGLFPFGDHLPPWDHQRNSDIRISIIAPSSRTLSLWSYGILIKFYLKKQTMGFVCFVLVFTVFRLVPQSLQHIPSPISRTKRSLSGRSNSIGVKFRTKYPRSRAFTLLPEYISYPTIKQDTRKDTLRPRCSRRRGKTNAAPSRRYTQMAI